ncbi:MAG: cellulase family glycosylhydrolase [Elusimicrobiota bacterium]
MKKPIYAVLIFLLFSAVQGLCVQPDPKDFIRRSGRNLVVGKSDKTIILRGFNFGNKVWEDGPVPDANHHSETDFRRLREMRMNVVRFCMDYQLFEDDGKPYAYRQSAWDWLDKNVAWAKKNGIYLILSMTIPQGGYQSAGEGMALWDVPENQKRLKALWKAIAERYKNEPVIAGLELVNEPYVSKSIDQWKTLAGELVSTIRTADKNHLIIVEQLMMVKGGDWRMWFTNKFFLVNDPGILYTFHFYHPLEYTHQLCSWAGTGGKEGGKYPDPDRIIAPDRDIAGIQYGIVSENPAVPEGNSAWTYYEGEKYHVTDPYLLAGKPALQTINNTGAVYFDDITVNEYGPDGKFIRTVRESGVNSKTFWTIWSGLNTAAVELTKTDGHSDNASLKITGGAGDAMCYNDDLRFEMKNGYYYSISGWMKGAGVPAGARCSLRIGTESSPSGKLMRRNKDYLEHRMKTCVQWGIDNNVPLYMGEFGAHRPCFENGRGGINWVRDMVELSKKYGLSFTYHAYHESSFGLFRNDVGLPDPEYANDELWDYFKSGNWQ